MRLFLVVLLLTYCAQAGAEKALQIALPKMRGGSFSLEQELKNGPLVLDFWATWCKPCIKALPKMQEIANEYKERDVRVVTVNVDGPRNQNKIRPFVRRHRVLLPVLLDKTGETLKQFHLSGVPATLIISADGEVVYKHQGYKPGDELKLKEALDRILDKRTEQERAGDV